MARNLFGEEIRVSQVRKSAIQLSLDDAFREAWLTKAHEFLTERGLRATVWSASRRFYAGGNWYCVGADSDGWPIVCEGPEVIGTVQFDE